MIELTYELNQREAGHPQGFRVVCAQFSRAIRKPHALAETAIARRHPAHGPLGLVAARGEAVGSGIGGIECNGPAEKPQRFLVVCQACPIARQRL